ncbi:hypothetical protein [uncultured Anaerococcus sp.]|uniref:hypothetical protein n=1 Tax=uncultured Anaerococcus sp. TaxID=293428 RepID=UPI002609A9E6|nr:hypothetical protein [uncultured Anaerococcus sp.]
MEDSENGYLAAKKSGIPFMIVPDSSFNYHNLTANKTYEDLYKVKDAINDIYVTGGKYEIFLGHCKY